MSAPRDSDPRCDAHVDGARCTTPPVYVCVCARCDREDDEERFRSCAAHCFEVRIRHLRIRDRAAVFEYRVPAVPA